MSIAPRFAVVVLITVSLFGCATSTSLRMNPDVSNRIQSLRAHVVIPQEEINAEVARSGFSDTTGLVGALIDVSVNAKRASKADLVIEPLRKELTGYDFRAEFEKQFRASQAELSGLKINKIEVTSEPYSVDAHNRLRTEVSQDSFLTMVVDYYLSADFRCLIVYTTATLFQRGKDDAQYLGNFRYLSAPIGSKSGEAAVKAWAEGNAMPLRAAFQEGISETIRMLKLDVVPKTDKEQREAYFAQLGPDGKLKIITIMSPRGIYKGGVTTNKLDNVASEILAKDGDRVIFRSKSADRYTKDDHIHSSTTRGRFVLPVVASPVPPSGNAKP